MKRYDTYLFDLDGTIYLGEELIPGAKEVVQELQSSRSAVRYVTNNPTRTALDYAQKLSDLGIATSPEEVFTSVDATVRWLVTNEPDAKIYPIGEEPLSRALTSAGLNLSHNAAEIDIVLASFDRTFTYEKLQTAFDALWYHRRARLMSTNPDKFCPYPGGKGEPDAAAIVAAIEASTGVKLERTFGKPGALLAQMALASISEDADANTCLMVGDRLHTDIAMGHAAEMDTALVLTGDSQRSDLQTVPFEPTWILPSVVGLVN